MLSHATIVDSVRLTTPDAVVILDALDRGDASESREAVRRYQRYPYRIVAGLAVRIPFDASIVYRVIPRNLSSGGIAFLHGCYVPCGTRCQIELQTIDRERVLVTATVLRVRLVRGRIHEIAAGFEQPVDIQNFVRVPASPTGEATEKLLYDPGQLLKALDRLHDLVMRGASRDQIAQALASFQACVDKIPAHEPADNINEQC